MTRLPPLQPPYDDETQAAFDAITPAGQQPLVLFRTLATVPRVYRRFRAGGLLDRGPLSLRQRELVIDRTCALAGCEYEWGVHVRFFATRAGLTPRQVAATVTGEPAGFAADEQVLLATCDALHARGDLADDEWTALRGHFDVAQVMEVLALVNFYRGVSLWAKVLRLPLEPYGARFAQAGAPGTAHASPRRTDETGKTGPANL